jgi:hypothetical protein
MYVLRAATRVEKFVALLEGSPHIFHLGELDFDHLEKWTD